MGEAVSSCITVRLINVHVCRLTADEYSSLSSNLVDIVSVHKDLLSSLEDIFRSVFKVLHNIIYSLRDSGCRVQCLVESNAVQSACW